MPMLRRLSAFRLNEAQTLMARGRPVEEYENALSLSEAAQVLWQASATLAEVRFGERRFAEAAQAYDRAIEIVKSETLTPTSPSPAEIQSLMDRAAQARLLAANDETPERGKQKFVQTAANAGGALGGVFSPVVRGIVPRAVPMPITFEYRSATLTQFGEQAARELLRAIREQNPPKVRVIGHTDARGSADYNLKLSKARAETVANFLRANGLAVPVEAEGVGFNEPMKIGAASGLSQDDIYALNRRVEWRRE
ncbi:MAG: OmpA family protein [Methylobacteriaceae bacterium]|nr:OmpA family protein [Methylobacteriaceae bacterium]